LALINEGTFYILINNDGKLTRGYEKERGEGEKERET